MNNNTLRIGTRKSRLAMVQTEIVREVILAHFPFLEIEIVPMSTKGDKILDRSLRPTGQILLVITGGGIVRWVLQDCGMGNIIGPALEKSGLPLVLIAFLIAALIRSSVGAAVVAMTMAAGIMAAMPGVAGLSPLYLAAMVCAINGGATVFSHVNDSGFWLVSSLLEINEKTTLKSWTMMETIIGITGLVCAIVISLFA